MHHVPPAAHRRRPCPDRGAAAPRLPRLRPPGRGGPHRRRGDRGVAERAPDVVLLDLHLPDLSGLEVFQQIRRLDARIPVIFITGHGTTDTAIEAMKLGAFDYLLKPLDLHAAAARSSSEALEVSRLMRVPAVVAETPRIDDRGRRHRRPLPGHAGGLQGHRPRRRPGRDRADPRRERHRQGAGRPRHLPAQPPGRRRRSWPSTAPPSPRRCWRASCSATRRAPSPAPTAGASASSSSASGGTLFLDEIGDMTRWHPGQDAAAAAGAALRAGRRQRDDPDRRAADRRHQPRPGGAGRAAGRSSGRTCTTG